MKRSFNGKELEKQVRSGNSRCILPLTAYYGTGRLWLQKRNRVSHYKGEPLNRQMGYVDCIAAESNERQMMQWFEDMTYIQLQEDFDSAVDREDYETAGNILKHIRSILGDHAREVIENQITLDVERMIWMQM